jgi:rhodanese-related sulfurtransferase/membrane protein insertase Oxa1/YidC/SpoIIIJ/phosphohistidine swiveling domain-containing protein
MWMGKPRCALSDNRMRSRVACAIGAAAALVLGTTPVLAIPSPELVVGSLVSVSQLVALASAILGGGAAYAATRSRRNGLRIVSPIFVTGTIISIVLFCASLAFNIHQHLEQSKERQARLEETLSRPFRTPGSLRGDPEVKELSYAQQMRQPNGITTSDANTLLKTQQTDTHSNVVFLDVRERPEHEMGTLPGAIFLRYPDIATSPIDLKAKKVVAFCHHGDRSHEICEALRQHGIDCNFIVGGIEKWVTEQRAMEGAEAHTLDPLQLIPRYPNDRVLLDAPEVRRLVANERITFVDVRYPADFKAHGHLPDAVNFPIQRVPTADLPRAMADIPKRPLVLPCYDRRSCFFAEVAGLELTRAGYDVRGRYTQPWAYFMPSGRPPHVEAWIEKSNQGLWGKAAAYLVGLMSAVSSWIGVVGAIMALAVISRLLVLPFSLKAERDQIRSRAAAEELHGIKARLRDDPVRKVRSIRAFYKRHGFTPARNLIALLFLPLMALAVLAVQELTAQANQGFLWLPDLALRDPLRVLPCVFAALITLYVDLAFVRTGWQRIAVWIAVFPLFVATGALFGAGTDIYLATSAALLIVQRIWVSGLLPRLWQAWRYRSFGYGVYSLDDVHELVGHGNKAYRLAQMRVAGLPVPDGLLLTPMFLTAFAAASPAERRARLNRLRRRLASSLVAVRSCASEEDSAQHSFAGVFESALNVDHDGLEAAISRVRASFESGRVKSYAGTGGLGSVLIQRMIVAEYAGVLFTRDPSASGLSMIELVKGTAENLVSGTARPQTLRFGRVSGKQFGEGSPPIDLRPLLGLGRQAERLFGCPQDIEWAYAGGRFQLVQSRDITRTLAGAGDQVIVQDDLARVLEIAKGATADEIVFSKNELSEMLPRPTTLSLALMQALWASGGSVDLAARKLGLTYQVPEDSTYLLTILGRLYVNEREKRARVLSIGPLASRRLLRDAERIERGFRHEFLPQYLVDVRLTEIADFDRLSVPELVEEIVRLWNRFVHETHVEIDIINIAAGFYVEHARRALSAAGLDASSFLGHMPETAEVHAFAEAAAAPAETRHWFLVRSLGHRAALDYELAEPRYSENADLLSALVDAKAARPQAAVTADDGLSKELARLVEIARRFETLKEDAKHHSVRELAALRRALLALDRNQRLGGLVFHLTLDEVAALQDRDVQTLRKTAVRRQEQARRLYETESLPSTLTAYELELISAGGTLSAPASSGVIRGTRVSGSCMLEARACVVSEAEVERGAELTNFQEGDIIVAPMISPAWLPYFSRAGGFISEVGGWLSHTAILAREYDVPMIVGTEGFATIANGSLLRLHLDGHVEVMDEPQKIERAASK